MGNIILWIKEYWLINFRIKKYTSVKQHDASDCAAASVATICNFYKKKIPITKIREYIKTDSIGTSVYGIVDGAKRMGFSAKGVKCSIDDLFETNNLPLPCIAHVLTKDKTFHFIVINEIIETKVIVSDPAKGVEVLDKEDFADIYTGIIIFINPEINFYDMKYDKVDIKSIFKHLIIPQRNMIMIVVCYSFLISIFSILIGTFSKLIFDQIVPYNLKTTLYLFIIIFIILIIIKAILEYSREIIVLFLSRKISMPLLFEYYIHILKIPYNFFSSRKTGDILTRFQDTMTVTNMLSSMATSLVLDSVLVLCTGTVLYFISSEMLLVVLAVIIINFMIIFFIKNSFKEKSRMLQQSVSTLNSHIIESVKGIEVIKAFNDEDAQSFKLENKYVSVLQNIFEIGRVQNTKNVLFNFFDSFGSILFMGIGTLSILDNKLTLGSVVLFQIISVYFISSINKIIALQLDLQEVKVSVERLAEFMELSREGEENKGLTGIDVSGDIEFKNVDFQYGSYGMNLEDINISIPFGGKIAIVGESGSGKSTLLKLLMKFYDATSGEIIINNINIKNINHEYYRNRVSYVAQNSEFFSGTILENLLLGIDDNIDVSIVQEALTKACCNEFIKKIPFEFNGVIEEGGKNLSGGEKQRLAIARIFLREKQYYFFDEPTNSLDSVTEKKVQRSIDEYTKGKTCIIVAHRLSTIINSDYIYYLENGRVVAEGTHVELLEQDVNYQSMIRSQYGGINNEKI